jgi:hypothetical protein
MLKRAILYQNQLPLLYTMAADDPHYRFLTTSFSVFVKKIEEDNWAKQQFVSVDRSDNVIGYFEADVLQKSHFIKNITMVRFKRESRYNLTFAKDIQEFFVKMFFYYEYKKMNFTVAVTSPNELWYDKFINKYGGRIVGIKKENFTLENGLLLDEKIYEIFKDDFKKEFKKLHPKIYDRHVKELTLKKG